MARARDGRRGSATVELVAGLPLLSVCVLIGWQGLTLARATAEAEADARAAARQLVACSSSTPDYRAIDANTDATSYSVVRGADAGGMGTTTVTVTLPPVSLMPVLGTVQFATVTPNGRVTMRQESC